MRKHCQTLLLLLAIGLLSSCQSQGYTGPAGDPLLQPNEDRSGCAVTRPPQSLGLDGFYTKYCSAQDIPIVASQEVDDLALQQAYYLINNILAPIPDVRNQLVADGQYIAIIGRDQGQTTLPEYADLDSGYWDARARGLGASKDSPVTSVGEENLLCLGWRYDRYYGENILIHEFAHTIQLAGLGMSYNENNNKLRRLYSRAIDHGLWKDTYASTNPDEYWAEGVQSYFNCNQSSLVPDGVHNQINTSQELAEYDPDLYEYIAEFFDDFAWDPSCPDKGTAQ